MHKRYYTWILVLLGLALATLVLTMTIQDKYDDNGTGVIMREKVRKKDQDRIHQEEVAPSEINLIEEGVDFDSDVLELSDDEEELDGFEDIDFEIESGDNL